MKKVKLFKKYLGRVSEIFVFLFVLAVFVFSIYKILSIAKIINPLAYGVSCDTCDFSWCGDCDFECGECWPCPPCPRPSPTPTPPPEPTPTPPPEPTPTLPPEVTPTPTLPPEMTPTPTPTSPPGEGGPPGPGEPPVCGATVPSAPTLLSATKRGSDTDLSWTAVDPVTHYAVSYGLSSNEYIYGVDNTGNVTSFTVGGLDPAADYCFAVRAVNDCAPSSLSNEICTGEVLGVGRVLGVTTLADTGSLTDDLFYILFIIGSVCLSLGLRKYPQSAKHLGRWS